MICRGKSIPMVSGYLLVPHVFGNGLQEDVLRGPWWGGAGVELAVQTFLAFATLGILEMGIARAFSQLSGASPHH